MELRNGAIGALIDEFERAVREIKAVLKTVSEPEFANVVDPDTHDENCRSIQTIVAHVVDAGYAYTDSVRDHFGIKTTVHSLNLPGFSNAETEFDALLNYTFQTFSDRWDLTDKNVSEMTIRTRWGADWGLEQLLEHAIVHVLRHRRQIERFLSLLRSA